MKEGIYQKRLGTSALNCNKQISRLKGNTKNPKTNSVGRKIQKKFFGGW